MTTMAASAALAPAALGSAQRPARRSLSGLGCQQLPRKRAGVLVLASSGGEPDLDKQWAQFKRTMKLPEVESRQNVTTQAPRFQRRWNDGPSADTVRRQESVLLNAWTSEKLMPLAGIGTMVLVIVLLFAAGGPPSDARCTLPWC